MDQALMLHPGCAQCGYGASWMRQEPCWGFPGCHARGALQDKPPRWTAGCNCPRCVGELTGYMQAIKEWTEAHGVE